MVGSMVEIAYQAEIESSGCDSDDNPALERDANIGAWDQAQHDETIHLVPLILLCV